MDHIDDLEEFLEVHYLLLELIREGLPPQLNNSVFIVKAFKKYMVITSNKGL